MINNKLLATLASLAVSGSVMAEGYMVKIPVKVDLEPNEYATIVDTEYGEWEYVSGDYNSYDNCKVLYKSGTNATIGSTKFKVNHDVYDKTLVSYSGNIYTFSKTCDFTYNAQRTVTHTLSNGNKLVEREKTDSYTTYTTDNVDHDISKYLLYQHGYIYARVYLSSGKYNYNLYVNGTQISSGSGYSSRSSAKSALTSRTGYVTGGAVMYKYSDTSKMYYNIRKSN